MIDADVLFEVLDEWNLWNNDLNTGIERPVYLQELLSYVERKEVLVLKGIRRCGKSTIMRQLMKRLVQQGVDKTQLLYVNLEIYQLKDYLSLDFFDFILKVYRERINKGEKVYFFIDEIQLMPDWERFIRTKYDLEDNIKFVVSGSNASLLSKELSTLLTGRNLTFEIKPLSFFEYKSFTLKPKFDDYLVYGGFPEVVLEKDVFKKKRLLQQYFEDIVNKDVINRHNIRNADGVLKLARYLVENSGSRFSINKLAKALSIDNSAVDNYISAMIDAYLIIRVDHFSFSLKKRFDKAFQPKYYVIDNGFFEVVGLNYSKDFGKRFENVVLNHIKNKDVSYYLGDGEVDFVFEKKAVNVTFVEDDIPSREVDGLLNFIAKHKGFELFLLTPSKVFSTHDLVSFVSFEEFFK